MIKNLPTIENISKLGYYKLFNLRKSLNRRLAERLKALSNAEEESNALKHESTSPKNALEKVDIVFADSKVIELKSEIFVIDTYLSEINKYLEPMLKELQSANQPGNQ